MSIAIALNKDCLSELAQMEDNLFDLALIDPPYFDYRTNYRKDKADKLSQSLVQQSREDQIRVVWECIRVLKPDRAFYFFTNWSNVYWIQQPFESFWRNMIIWDKGNWTAGDLKGSFGNQYEVIFLGVKGRNWRYKGKREHDIWPIARMGIKRIHSTEKPIELYRKIIENSTDEGQAIVDPYGGSGVSAEAALSLNRHILTYDIDPEYCKRIQERIDTWKIKNSCPSSVQAAKETVS